jgi:hypothetical protein
MDWRYLVLILAVILIPFVMMGKNPFEPPEGYVPPDEFKDGIRSKIEQPTGFQTPGGFSLGGTGGNPNGGFGSSGLAPMPLSNSVQPSPTIPYDSNIGVPQPQGNQAISGLNPPANVGLNAPSQTGVAPAPSQASPFAPQPLQQEPQHQQPAPFRNLPTPGSKLEILPGYPSFRDNNGRLVAFFGAEVFTTDKHGRAKVMEDGEYTLSNGHTLIVKDGKKWWPSDANKLN